MRKVFGGVLMLMVLLVATWGLTRWLTIRRVNAELVDEVLNAWNAREPRNGTMNENGFACVAAVQEENVDFRSVTPALVTSRVRCSVYSASWPRERIPERRLR